MEIKNLAAVESTGTSSEIKEQHKKMKSLLGGVFYFLSPPKGKIKAMKTDEMRKKVKRNGKSRKREHE